MIHEIFTTKTMSAEPNESSVAPNYQLYGIPQGFHEISLAGTTSQRDWLATVNAYALPDVIDIIKGTAEGLGEWHPIEGSDVMLQEEDRITEYGMGFETSFLYRAPDADVIQSVRVYFPTTDGQLDYSHVPLIITNQGQDIDDTMYWGNRLVIYSRMRIAQHYHDTFGYGNLRGRAYSPFIVGR